MWILGTRNTNAEPRPGPRDLGLSETRRDPPHPLGFRRSQARGPIARFPARASTYLDAGKPHILQMAEKRPGLLQEKLRRSSKDGLGRLFGIAGSQPAAARKSRRRWLELRALPRRRTVRRWCPRPETSRLRGRGREPSPRAGPEPRGSRTCGSVSIASLAGFRLLPALGSHSSFPWLSSVPALRRSSAPFACAFAMRRISPREMPISLRLRSSSRAAPGAIPRQ